MGEHSKTIQVLNWMDQEVKTQMEWVRTVKIVTDPKVLEAYEAGIRHGWMKAYSTLNFQGMLK